MLTVDELELQSPLSPTVDATSGYLSSDSTFTMRPFVNHLASNIHRVTTRYADLCGGCIAHCRGHISSAVQLGSCESVPGKWACPLFSPGEISEPARLRMPRPKAW